MMQTAEQIRDAYFSYRQQWRVRTAPGNAIFGVGDIEPALNGIPVAVGERQLIGLHFYRSPGNGIAYLCAGNGERKSEQHRFFSAYGFFIDGVDDLNAVDATDQSDFSLQRTNSGRFRFYNQAFYQWSVFTDSDFVIDSRFLFFQ